MDSERFTEKLIDGGATRRLFSHAKPNCKILLLFSSCRELQVLQHILFTIFLDSRRNYGFKKTSFFVKVFYARSNGTLFRIVERKLREKREKYNFA
jgi:hypothetical protein